VVAGYSAEDKAERVFLVRIADGQLPRPLATLTLERAHPRRRKAPPGLAARDARRLTLVVTDGVGAVLGAAIPLDNARAAALTPIAAGADTRFAPAVSHTSDRVLVAYTEGTTPMRTWLVLLDQNLAKLETHDITPAAMGAAAPSFVAGVSPPILVAIDARDGLSPLLRVRISSQGVVTPTDSVQPVGMLDSPARLAAVFSAGAIHVGYTAIGSAATSAVGLVLLDGTADQPRPLVKGTAYGRLYVSAAAAPAAALFAVDAPSAPGKDPPREVHVRMLRDGVLGQATVVHGPGRKASYASIARNDMGVVAVAFADTHGVYVALLKCNDT